MPSSPARRIRRRADSVSEDLKRAFRSAVQSVAVQLMTNADQAVPSGAEAPLRTAILWILAGCGAVVLRQRSGVELSCIDLVRLVAPENVFVYTSEYRPSLETSACDMLFALLKGTIHGAGSAAGECVASLYEDILCFDLRADGFLSANSKAKKSTGNFYTRKDLADLAIREALAPLVTSDNDLIYPEEILNLRIIDPAMGGGSFLISAVDYLEAVLKESHACRPARSTPRNWRAEAIQHCIHGVDIDNLATVLCRIILLIESNCEEQELPSFALQLCRNIKSDDSLFLNWRHEFPDVFGRLPPGFDAVIGNPPWEIHKPNSREFFQQYDPEYWCYGKQEALLKQQEVFEKHPHARDQWNQYQSGYKRLKQSLQQGSFRYQGRADLNAYKLFLEVAHSMMRNNGLLSFIVPSGIYSDLGAKELRRLFIEDNRWRTIFGFENRASLFDIHRSFKFCLITVQKGGATESIKCSFMSSNPIDCHDTIEYPSTSVAEFSPHAFSIIELENQRDLRILQKLYDNGCRLGEAGGWQIEFEREFDMTNDSDLFAPVTAFRSNGFQRDQYGHWLKGKWRSADDTCGAEDVIASCNGSQFIAMEDINDIALPLYEGRMIGQFDFSEKGWVKGKGRQAVWEELELTNKNIQPQYLLSFRHYEQWQEETHLLKCAFLGVGSATNSRSMIASALDSVPCGNSVPVLKTQAYAQTLQLLACLNSYVFDFALRCRMAGNNLNYFLVSECPLPHREQVSANSAIARLVASLNLNSLRFAPYWPELTNGSQSFVCYEDPSVRRRLRAALDAIVAHLYGVDDEDLSWILRGCGEDVSERAPKGFWRTDRHLCQSERQALLTQSSFAELQRLGLPEYCRALEQQMSGAQSVDSRHARTWQSAEMLLHARRISQLRSHARRLWEKL